MTERCTRKEMAECMSMAEDLKEEMIRFVAVPVYNEDDYKLFMDLRKLKMFEMGVK